MICFTEEETLRFRAEGHWGDVTLTSMFEATCIRVPERIGLIDAPNRKEIAGGDAKRLTYGEMAAEVDRYAALLQGHGVRKGSIVATQLPNIAEMILIYLAVAKVGAILSPISMAYRSAELVSLSETARFDAFISVGSFKGQAHYEERLGALPASAILLGIGDDLPAGVARLDDAVPATGPRPVETSADDLFAIFWTSGTEGIPKAVPKTHNNMMASSLGAWRILDLPDGANILAPFPFVNAAAMGGLMMCWMRTAGALILHHPFDIATFLRQLADEDISYTMVAPTLLVYLRDKAADPGLHPALHRMRAIGTGAAPPDPEVFAFFQNRFEIPVVNFFGSNEGAQLCSAPGRVSDPRRRARYFPRDGDENWLEGRGLKTANGGTFKLVDPSSGAVVTEPGQIAEMYLRGPAMMPGYYTPNGFARARFDNEGFFATADLFEIS